MAEALILAADDRQRNEWMGMMATRGLSPTATHSPAMAQWLIEDHHFCMALLEWIPASGRPAIGTPELLSAFRRAHRDVPVIVSIPPVDDIDIKRAIHSAHPHALTHDSALGDVTLAMRIDGLMGRRVGDLVVDGGNVVHLPTGDRFQHPIAAQLLLAHPGAVSIDYTSTSAMRISRLRRWLTNHDSSVQIVNEHGLGMYRMTIAARRVIDVPSQVKLSASHAA